MLKTNAMRMLDKDHISYDVYEYEVDENDLSGVSTAQKIQQPHEMIFKTLVLKTDKKEVIVCCIPVASELDLKKVAKAAKGNANKKDKPNFFSRAGKGTKQFFKDFKGECKKIVWPDAKTVLKSTGVVLLVVTIVCIVVYGIDQGLSAGIGGLKSLANPEETTVETTLAGEKDETAESHDHSHEEETTEEATSEAEETTSEKAE